MAAKTYLGPSGQNRIRPSGGVPDAGAIEAFWTLKASACKFNTQKNSNKTHVLFCDVEKAFDGVWREGLLFLLYTYGVRGRMLRMLFSWQDGAKAVGLWFDAKTGVIDFTQGIRQGCVLSTLLYITFTSSLTNKQPSSPGHLYPDLLEEAFRDNLSGPEHGIELNFDGTKVRTACKLFVDDTALLAEDTPQMQKNC